MPNDNMKEHVTNSANAYTSEQNRKANGRLWKRCDRPSIVLSACPRTVNERGRAPHQYNAVTGRRWLGVFLLLGHVALGAQRSSLQTFPWTICRSVCPVHCGKTADRIRMPFGIVGPTGPGMRQVVRFGDGSREGVFGGEFGARHCNQWGLYSICVRQRRDAALFPNYFGQTCSYTPCSFECFLWHALPGLAVSLQLLIHTFDE